MTYPKKILPTLAFVVAGSTFWGCQAPTESPDNLESLLGFVFQHMDDADPDVLAEGLDKLHVWFQDSAQFDGAREGYIIENLSAQAISQLDDEPRSTEDLEGVLVATKSRYCSAALASLLTWDEFDKMLENFSFYRREFVSDPSCFATRACLEITAESRTQSAWAGLVEMQSEYWIQFRWVYTQTGWMMVQRFWLKYPVIGDTFEVVMNANYYVGIIMDDGAREAELVSTAFRDAANGMVGLSGYDVGSEQQSLSGSGSLRIHANWFNIDTGLIPLPKAAILNTLVSGQINDSTQHDAWLDAHPELVNCPESADDTTEEATP